jgi:peptidoglycan hydrolase CwlO-like protein
MLSRPRPFTNAARSTLAALAICAATVGLSSRLPAARAVGVGQLQQKITSGRGQISSLQGTVRAASGHVAQLDAGIAVLARRLSAIQTDIDAKSAELDKLRVELTGARTRLTRLEASEAHAEQVLAQQLVGTYESAPPDIVTVVLSATGFQDLLNRLSFMQRVRSQDASIVSQVRSARRAVSAQATRLGKLEIRQQTITEEVVAQRDQLSQTSASLETQRAAVARFRDAKAGQLASARAEVGHLQHQLSQLEAAQARLAAPQSPAPSAGSSPAPRISSGPVSASGFTFPLPKSAAAPPSEWSPDQGVDISAPGNTPEYAACSGTVVLHGIGGFGPWAPVLHCDGTIAGYSYVYYGHAGPLYQLPIGTHVSAGQVMSSIGPGIVGLSSGPHLEIGFADSSGSPIGNQTAGTMLSLLHAAYGG